MKKIFLIMFCTILLVGTVSAEEFGYNYLEGELNVVQAVNYTQLNVNDSKYWDGNAWSNTRWLNIDGSNANTNINISPYNLTAGYGFFDFLGDFANRVTKLFVKDIDFNGNINGTGNITTTGDLRVRNVNATGNASIGTGSPFLEIYYDGTYIIFNSIDTDYFTKGIIVNGSLIVLGEGNFTEDLYVNNSDFFVDVSTGRVGIGTSNPQNTLNVIGDFNQSNGNSTFNMIYGEMWNHTDAGFVVDLITVQVYENITDLTDGSQNGFTLSNSKLTAQLSGLYRVYYSISFSGSANSEIGFSVGIGGVEQDQTHSHRTLGTGGDIGNTGGTGYIFLNQGDVVTLMARDEASPVKDINIIAANLNLMRIGN